MEGLENSSFINKKNLPERRSFCLFAGRYYCRLMESWRGRVSFGNLVVSLFGIVSLYAANDFPLSWNDEGPFVDCVVARAAIESPMAVAKKNFFMMYYFTGK
jgi:hypothetical protein